MLLSAVAIAGLSVGPSLGRLASLNHRQAQSIAGVPTEFMHRKFP